MIGGGGREFIVGAVRDVVGPLVMAGAGGTLADVLDDRVFRLAPLGPAEADEMIGELRIARVLDGVRGAAPLSRTALRDVLVRIGALAADLPEVVELDLNPVICRAHDAVVVDARIRVAPQVSAPDPLVRQLRPVRSMPSAFARAEGSTQ
jgi:acyl-CoA synthetase (NDP forming)